MMKSWLSQVNLFQRQKAPVEIEQGKQKCVQKALDQLFTLTTQYRSSTAYNALLSFVSRFRFYSPYNAMLVHVQMPGAKFVASPSRWLSDYGRRIRPEARPIIILQPGGPVMFVFDVSDSEAQPGAPALPSEVTNPFEIRRGRIGNELETTTENAKRDGVRMSLQSAGSQSAGLIKTTASGEMQEVVTRRIPALQIASVPIRYELLVNNELSREATFATVVHELAHLYCGHLGTPDPTWWSDRRGLPLACQEFEAESVCYLVCERLGIDNPSEKYLHSYLEKGSEVPPISLEAVMTASGLIESMGRKRLPLRKPGPKTA